MLSPRRLKLYQAQLFGLRTYQRTQLLFCYLMFLNKSFPPWALWSGFQKKKKNFYLLLLLLSTFFFLRLLLSTNYIISANMLMYNSLIQSSIVSFGSEKQCVFCEETQNCFCLHGHGHGHGQGKGFSSVTFLTFLSIDFLSLSQIKIFLDLSLIFLISLSTKRAVHLALREQFEPEIDFTSFLTPFLS